MKWYAFYPSDTLFLRGAEPMVGGTDYDTTQLFPPPVSVISGAIRTAVLAQREISIPRYRNGEVGEVMESIGAYGEPAPFNVVGPLIRYRSDFFVPAPYTWYVEELPEEEKRRRAEKSGNPDLIDILKIAPLAESTVTTLGLKTSTRLNGWVKHRYEIKSIGGAWVSLKAMMQNQTPFENGTTLFLSALDPSPSESGNNGAENRDARGGGKAKQPITAREERIGIAIDARRRVQEGKIYTARHIRLNPEMALVWAVDRECGLAPEGVISMGGEQRFGKYEEIETDIERDLTFSEGKSPRYLALSPVPVTPESQAGLIASGKIIYRGGWDLAKQFHKDMRPYYPAGSVFDKKVDPGCIAPFKSK